MRVLTALTSAVVLLAVAGCGGDAPAEPASAAPVETSEPTPTETVILDPDQARYYEAMRSASGFADLSDEKLDELAVAACTDIAGYSGSKDLAVASMTATFTTELGDHAAAQKAVAALVARWCPEQLD